MSYSRRLLNALNGAASAFVAISLITLSLLLFSNIIARNVIRHSYIGTETLAMYLMVWMTFLGAAVIIPKYGHVSVDLLLRMSRTRPWLRRTIGVVMFACAAIVSCYFFVYCAQLTYVLFQSPGTEPSLDISLGYLYLLVTLGAGLMLLNCLDMLIGLLRGDDTKLPPVIV